MLRQLAPSAGAGEHGGAALLRQLLRALDGRYPSSLDAAINAVLGKGPEQQQEAALVGSQALQKPLSEEAVRGLQGCLREALAGSMRQPLSAGSQTLAVALDSPAAEMRVLVSRQSLQDSAHGTSPALQDPASRQAGTCLVPACASGESIRPVPARFCRSGSAPCYVGVCVR